MEKTNSYTTVKHIVDSLALNQTLVLDIPDNMKAFRKYLSVQAQIANKRYITKIKGNKLFVRHITGF